MHRRKARLVARTQRVAGRFGFAAPLVRTAKNVEYRGIITTYKVHDRMLGNRTARRRFEHAPPPLDEAQRRVLADLERDDYAVLPFADLVPDQAVRAAIEREGAQFVSDTERELAATTGRVVDLYKDYLVRRYRDVPELPPDAPWLACCLSDRMLALANAYLHMWSKLEYVDYWYSVPVDASSDRIQSQRWHRDFDDRHLLKAFLYLVDVDERTGPLEFVAGSARGRTAEDFYPWYPGSPTYPPDREFDEAVDAADIKTFTASAGTLILCNTSGFHRGGFATAKPRVLATATYCSPASLASLTQRNYRLPKGAERALTPAQRYAVS
ncbi:MAG TPA: hypothetical protein VFR32_00090 [Gaiellaceae bacterium]|nr:hypothetical protein [Gaiellaceae bacterium]